MKKYLRNLLALLLCAALLCGALAAMAEGLELELPEIEIGEGLPDAGEALELEEDASEALDLEDVTFSIEDYEFASNTEENSASTEGGISANGGYYDDYGSYIYEDENYHYEIDKDGTLDKFYFVKGSTTTHFDIPEGVKKIGGWGALAHEGLTSVSFPKSLEAIDGDAFAGNPLKTIVIPGTVKSITGSRTFFECTELESVTIMDGVEELSSYMFEECTSLKSASIPGSVKEVPYDIFVRCSALTDVTIGYGVEELSVSAFSGCSSLETITIPGSIKDFGGIECTNLKTAILGDGVETMANSAFNYSKKTLANITIPGSLKLIDSWTFRDFESLASVTLKEGIEEIGTYAFHNCTSLNSVVIPGSVKIIGHDAFEGCTSLNKVEIQDGVEEIRTWAFLDCPISEIYIPESVTSIFGQSIGYKSVYGEDGAQSAAKRDGVIIRGKFGSAAEQYANNNGFTFKGDPVDPKSVAITTGKSAELEAGKKLQLETSLKPEFATTTFTWKSSNKKVATVNSKGLVKAVAKGQATITVTTKNGKTASIKVKVVAATPTRITINQGKSATLYMGNTLKLTTKLAPAKAESKLTWSSSKPAVATVSSKGVVTPKKAGTAKITVKTANGKKASITVKVVDAQSVKLKEGKSKTLKVGKKLTLHATVSPAKVKTKLTWTSSNAKVAAVSSKGVVTAKKAGTAKITVKTANGKSATITITVK